MQVQNQRGEWEEIRGTSGALDVHMDDGPQLDAFGRLRVSHPHGVFDSKQISTNDPYVWEELLVGTATATYQHSRCSTYLSVGTTSGDRAVRQTVRYLAYVPGKSHQVICTGIFAPSKAGLDQYIGYGDDFNGIFFKMEGNTPGVLIRSSVSGSVVNNFIPQSDWNIDKLDGTGVSNITLDPTKAQIFIIDFQWLGVGRVRFGLDINGIIVGIHEVNHANISSSVYMASPTLPVRYEIVNTTATSSASTLEQICTSVSSEGGYAIPGTEFSISNGITRKAVTTRVPVLLVRLKNEFPAGKANRRTCRVLNFGVTTSGNNAYIELIHLHHPTVVATWNDIDDSSGVEYATTITSLTAEHTHRVKSATAMTGQGNSGGAIVDSVDYINMHSFISQNFDSTNSQIFAIYATAESGTADVSSSMTFIESE